MTTQAEQFAALFAGLTRAKGRYVLKTDPSQAVVGDKAKGKATTVSEPVTLEDYQRHLAGEIGLGIVPVRDDGTCVFGAIDIDQYTGLDHAELVKKAEEAHLSLMVCRSKSGGAHVYTFINEPGIQAAPFIEYLKKVRTSLGIDYRKAREIFPKQKAQSGGIGNWINLPYFGETPRKAIRADGTEYSLEDFLSTAVRIESKSLTITVKDELINPTELPPCLERLLAEGIPAGMRNEAGFNFSVFAAKKCRMDRPLMVPIVQALNNGSCRPPLPMAELNTSIDSVIRHEYNYRCSQSPIVDVCNKELCATRPFGPHASNRPGNIPDIEKIEIKGDENAETLYYIKLLNSPRVLSCNSRTLMTYDLFKMAVLDSCHVMLPVVKQKDWDMYITARFIAFASTMRVAAERTKRGLIGSAIDEWIKQSASKDPKFFAIGRPFIDGNNIYISFGELGSRLRHVQNDIKLPDVARLLEDSGWEKTTKIIGERSHENVWTHTIEEGTELPDEKVDVIKEVDGHIVMAAPEGLPATLVDELTWDQFSGEEDGPE